MLLQTTKFYPFLVVEQYFLVCLCVCAFNTSSSVDGPLGCFHILTVVNNSAVKIGIHVSFQISVFIFFVTIPSGEIVGLFGSSFFSFLRHFHTVFLVATPVFILTNWCTRIPFPPHLHQHLFFMFLIY